MAYEQKGYSQLTEYLKAKGLQKGYLVSFCTNIRMPQESRWLVHDGHTIYETIVECG